jgi:hypothetical protein
MVLTACAPAPARPSLDEIASRYIRLTQELARHDPSLIDHWLTEAPPAPDGGRRPVASLALAIESLVRQVEEVTFDAPPEARPRAEWLQGQIRALRLAARRLMGDSLPFDSEARLAFDLTPGRADLFVADRAREGLERLLPGSGTLAERLAAFRARFAVADERRDAVMQAAMTACREATRDAVPLPDDESIELAFVDGLPWDGHARYLGGHRTRIEVNGSQALDLTRAVRLACHEGYAGHHVQHIVTADDLVGQRNWPERALVPGFGPALLVAEGAADAATDLALPPDQRRAVYRTLAEVAGFDAATREDVDRLVEVEEAQRGLEPLIGDIARDYLDSRINATEAARRLEAEALMPAPEGFVFFIERRRTRILAYTDARRLAHARLGAAGLAGVKALMLQ